MAEDAPRNRSDRIRRAVVGQLLAWLVVGAGGCAPLPLLDRHAVSLPERHTLAHEPLVFHSDFQLPLHHRLIDDLRRLRADMISMLDLPTSDEPVHLYLFDSADRYAAFVKRHYPQMAARRALFLETDTRLVVLAHWGDRVAEDLRHEVAHGYLHAVVPQLPLWLDEGLAEYFEVARRQRGVNGPHVQLLLDRRASGTWSPDMRRLEQIPTFERMTQQDYAESWAWVYWLLNTTPARRIALQDYLKALRGDELAQPLSEHLATLDLASPELAEGELLALLKSLEQGVSVADWPAVSAVSEPNARAATNASLVR